MARKQSEFEKNFWKEARAAKLERINEERLGESDDATVTRYDVATEHGKKASFIMLNRGDAGIELFHRDDSLTNVTSIYKIVDNAR